MHTTLGKRIASYRHEKGMKQDELAEKLNVSPQAVSKWENDQSCPDISLLPLLASIFGISVDELLSGKKETTAAVRMLPENERKEIKDMMLRLVATEAAGGTVRINLPLAIVEIAIDSGLNLSQISNNETLKNIDLSKILDLARQGTIGNLLEAKSANGDTVQIFVE